MSRTRNWFAANPRQSGAVHLQLGEQLLDPVLDVPARAGDPLVEGPRRSSPVGHDGAGTSRPGISVIAPRNEVGTPRLPRTPAAARQKNSVSTGNTSTNPAKLVPQHVRALTARYLRRVLADPERHARGRARPRVPGRTPLRPRELDRSRFPGAADGDHHRRLDAEAGLLVGLLEAADDRRHVAEVEAAPVGSRPEDRVLELRPAEGLLDRPPQDCLRSVRTVGRPMTSAEPRPPPGRTSSPCRRTSSWETSIETS